LIGFDRLSEIYFQPGKLVSEKFNQDFLEGLVSVEPELMGFDRLSNFPDPGSQFRFNQENFSIFETGQPGICGVFRPS
jgi:hypothetical protein